MPGDLRRIARGRVRGRVIRELVSPGEVPQPDRMADKEDKSADGRDPDQKKRDVNRDVLPPRTFRPLNQAHFASSTPRMERFTRLRISGTLYPLCCNGCAPWMASSPAILAVSSLRGFPLTASSTAFRRTGCAATPFTAIRMRSTLPPV